MTAPDGVRPLDNVIAFQPRAPAGDWSASELERLAELARKLEGQGAHVGAVYGVSDAGDPWCVITNEADEVLIHVARIGGRFVIHDAEADALRDGDTLWSACDRLLGESWRNGREDGVVIPLHQAQVLLAVVVAMVFEQEGLGEASGPVLAPQATTGHAEPAAASRMAIVTATADPHIAADPHLAAGATAQAGPHDDLRILRTVSFKPDDPPAVAQSPRAGSAQLPPEPAPDAALALDHTAATAQLTAAAAPSDGWEPGAQEPGRVLSAGHGGAILVGGPGDDTLAGGGAAPGQVDVLLGGGGADRLLMAARTVAIGGPGHDVFVFSRPGPPSLPSAPSLLTPQDLHPQTVAVPSAQPAGPTATAPSETLPAAATPPAVAQGPAPGVPAPAPQAGVIVDFTADDRLDFGTENPVMVVSVSPVLDVLAGLHQVAGLASFSVTPGAVVGFDFDGDGVADLTVLVAGPATGSLTVGAKAGGAPAVLPPADHAEVIVASIHGLVPGAFLLG